MEDVVIVGAGQAGARAALALRDAGWTGGVMLLGDEGCLPYERPPLSKEVLEGTKGAYDALIATRDEFAAKAIELRANAKVRSVDLPKRIVRLDSGAELPFGSLVFATGARARSLNAPGADLPGVYTLRSGDDANRLSDALKRARRLVVVGGGFVGLEVAAMARKLGLVVTVLEQAPVCLGRVLPAAAADLILKLHTDRGVEIYCSAAVSAVEGEMKVERVRLSDGRALDADIVVVGIGSIANDELARQAGVACNNGIVVDDACRTSVPMVFAIGDVASRFQPGQSRALRIESWENAERQGARVAATITESDPEHEAAPWFWTDQYDVNVQMVGLPSGGDDLVLRPGGRSDEFIQFFLRDHVVSGAVLFNSGRERRTVTKLVGKRPDVHDLRNPAKAIRQIAATLE